jgi:hypothetical protein
MPIRYSYTDAGAARRMFMGLALFAMSAAQAQILKCVDAKGNVEFSNQSCQKGWTRQELAIKENTVNSSGAREQALLLENQRLKEQLQKSQAETAAQASAPPGAPAAPILSEADLQAQRLRSGACDDAARRYELAAGSISPQLELIAARRSGMFAACGIREPDSVQIIHQAPAARPCLLWGRRMVRSPVTGLVQPLRACLALG